MKDAEDLDSDPHLYPRTRPSLLGRRRRPARGRRRSNNRTVIQTDDCMRSEPPSLVLAAQEEAGARKDAEEDSDEEDGEGQGSKRKRRLEARMKIASLKQACPRPDVVEVWDVTSTDPKLLVWLKVRPAHAVRLRSLWGLQDPKTRSVPEP